MTDRRANPHRLYRDRDHAVLAGVCAGIAEYFGLNRKGVRIYSDMIGKQVAEPFVTVVDQATIPRERGALNYDDEGNEAGRTVLVEGGILKSYLHDTIIAKQ